MSDCPNCDFLNPDSAKFCQQCGTPLAAPIATEPPATPQTEQPLGMPKGLTFNQKVAIVGVLFVTTLVIGTAALLSYAPNQAIGTSPTSPPKNTPSWHSVTTFSHKSADDTAGGYDLVTDTFHIKGTKFRLDWSYSTNVPDYSVLYVFAYGNAAIAIDDFCRAGGTHYPSCPRTTYSDTGVLIESGPGDFHLSISSVNLDWSAIVEDYY